MKLLHEKNIRHYVGPSKQLFNAISVSVCFVKQDVYNPNPL